MTDAGNQPPVDPERSGGSDVPPPPPPPPPGVPVTPPPSAGGTPNPPQYGYQPYGQPMPGPIATPGQPVMVSLPGVGTVKVATVMQRFLARLIDSVILGVAYLIISFAGLSGVIATSVDPVTGQPTAGFFGAMFLLFAVITVLGILYEVTFIALQGQTPGKMAMGVKVVLQDNGQVPGWGPSFVRYLIPAAASFITCGLGGLIVYLSPLFDKSGLLRGWHDAAAKDQVISTR